MTMTRNISTLLLLTLIAKWIQPSYEFCCNSRIPTKRKTNGISFSSRPGPLGDSDHRRRHHHRQQHIFHNTFDRERRKRSHWWSSSSLSPPSSLSTLPTPEPDLVLSIEDAIQSRYACTRYERNNDDLDGGRTKTISTETTATTGDPDVIETARRCLDLARRAPSGFNVQPYRLILVSDPPTKQRLAQYCCGHNAHRVRDSDCTVVFLADRQPLRGWNAYKRHVMGIDLVDTTMTKKKMTSDDATVSEGSSDGFSNEDDQQKETTKDVTTLMSKLLTWFKRFKVFVFIAIFTQGVPYLPTIIAEPMSAIFCFMMRLLSWITRRRYPLPTVSSSIAWSQKNTMLVAMSYMLLCTSQRLATTPMEGFTAWGIRRVLKIPRRYTIPLIVATGRPFIRNRNQHDNHAIDAASSDSSGCTIESKRCGGRDDAGMLHGNTKGTTTKRYPREMMIYDDLFGTCTHSQ